MGVQGLQTTQQLKQIFQISFNCWPLFLICDNYDQICCVLCNNFTTVFSKDFIGQLLPSTFIGRVSSLQHSCDPTCIIRAEVEKHGISQLSTSTLQLKHNTKSCTGVPVGLIMVATGIYM